MSRLSVDAARCVGHGRCYELAPALFAEDQYGYSKVVQPGVSGEQEVLARQAEHACPENAVRVED